MTARTRIDRHLGSLVAAALVLTVAAIMLLQP